MFTKKVVIRRLFEFNAKSVADYVKETLLPKISIVTFPYLDNH